MAKTFTPPFTQTIKDATITTFVNADGTSLKTIATSQADQALVTKIIVTTDDTSSNTVFLYINNGSTDAPLGHCALPIGSGTNGSTTQVTLLKASSLADVAILDNNAQAYIPLGANSTLKLKMNAAVTAAKTVWVTVFQENY